jgi:hypothetical protein
MPALLLGGVGQERADPGQLARSRRCRQALSAALGKERAQVRRAEIEQRGRVDTLAPVETEEIDQPVRSCDIGAHRVRRPAAVMLEIG